MGLDCYWTKPGESKSTPLDFDPPLCFEGEHDRQQRREGWAHFRGNAAADLIEELTGVSLYGHIENHVVMEMADILERDAFRRPMTDMVRDLARLFRAYGKAGYELRGSW